MKHRFEVLDIFRGIFASMVVFFHMCGFSNTIILNNSFILNSDLFVDFFFVLSGFVITYTHQSLARANDMKLFLKKKAFSPVPFAFCNAAGFCGYGSGQAFFGRAHTGKPVKQCQQHAVYFFYQPVFSAFH